MPSGFSNRMTSLVHAVLMLFVSAWAIDFSQQWTDFGQKTTPKQVHMPIIAEGDSTYIQEISILQNQKSSPLAELVQ